MLFDNIASIKIQCLWIIKSMSFNEETLYSNNNETVNSKQIALLKKHFPQCFDKTGNFIQEKMLDIVNTNDIDLSKESYSLNWLGKSYARLLTNLPPETLLTEDKVHNQLEENKESKNLLIKGDNLEVLKHLVHAYTEEVKMIYIDPPYNTEEDGFVYDDSKKFTKEQLSELAKIDIDEAERILEFTNSKSNSHSAWLTFMYPRLYIAKELLKDDGVIFISIDDNELNQLKILCDEVFGAQNFVANFIWEKRTNRENRKVVSSRHDYILCYARNQGHKGRVLSQLPMTKKALANYKNPDNDPNGKWKSDPATAQAGHATTTQFYDVVSPNGKIHKLESGRCWLYTKEVMDEEIKAKRIWLGKEGNGVPRVKTYLDAKVRGLTPETIMFSSDVGTNETAKNQLKELFNEVAVFETPKPVSLLMVLMQMALNEGIVLDFFSGSATIGQAVMELNSDSAGERTYIAVQLAEQISENKDAYKIGYRNIFEISKARIEKSAQRIKEKKPDYRGDLGFKIFETVEDFRRDSSALTIDNLSFFDDALLTVEQYESLLTTWVLYDGSLLTDEVIDIELSDYKAHYCNGRLYLLGPHFTTNALKAILLKLDNDADFSPHKVVLYGSNFDSAKQRELNEALSSYANKKSLELDIMVRN